jgi:hypothetical protein
MKTGIFLPKDRIGIGGKLAASLRGPPPRGFSSNGFLEETAGQATADGEQSGEVRKFPV